MDKVHVYLDDAGQWRWQRRSENGQIVAVSGEGYVNKAHAQAMAEQVNKEAEVVID